MARLFQDAWSALQADLWGALGIAAAILVLFTVAESWKRIFQPPVEWTRKLVHAGAGVVVLTFPWLLHSPWTVGVLGVAFGGLLVAGKKTGLLSSIHNVERKTSGAYYYPLAVFALFVLSKGDPLTYCVPLLVMALADSTAAMVGLYRGLRPYKVMDGERTIEGSATFFAVSYIVVITGLILSDRAGPTVVLAALVVAAITTSVEAISVRGSDNLFIPYAAWMTLVTTGHTDVTGLAMWLFGMALTGGAVAVTYRRGKVTVAGGATLFLVGTCAFALGGWKWWLPFVATWLMYLFSKIPDADTDLDAVFGSTAGPLIVILAYAHTGSEKLFVPYLVTQSANGAIIAMYYLDRVWRRLSSVAALAGAFVPLIPALAFRVEVPLATIMCGGMIGVLLFGLIVQVPFKGRRMAASLACAVIAWVVLA